MSYKRHVVLCRMRKQANIIISEDIILVLPYAPPDFTLLLQKGFSILHCTSCKRPHTLT